MKCPRPKCGYVWEPRVAEPKACPKCHQRLDSPWKIRGTKEEVTHGNDRS